MALTVTAPANDTKLTTKDAVKTELGLGVAEHVDDTFFDALIQQASDAIARYCRRPFALETISETLPGYGDTQLLLSRTPIVSVASVLHNGDIITDYSIEDRDAGVLFRRDLWTWTAGIGWNLTDYVRPGSEEPQFTVVYDAGFVLSGEGRTLPYDVERACITTVKAWYAARARDPNLVSKSLDGAIVSKYREPSELAQACALTAEVIALLKPWRRVA